MKKKKFNLLLNIATLCLCVAAIAFGVYSAKTASLNVSGTIGFNAHGGKYELTQVSITGALTSEGDVYDRTITYGDGTGETAKRFFGSWGNAQTGKLIDNNTITFAETMYLNDLELSIAEKDVIKDIVITLNITNYSQFDTMFVNCELTTPTIPNATITSSTNVVYTANDKMGKSTDGTTAGGTCVVTMTIKTTLNEGTNFLAGIASPLGFTLKFNFDKYSQPLPQAGRVENGSFVDGDLIAMDISPDQKYGDSDKEVYRIVKIDNETGDALVMAMYNENGNRHLEEGQDGYSLYTSESSPLTENSSSTVPKYIGSNIDKFLELGDADVNLESWYSKVNSDAKKAIKTTKITQYCYNSDDINYEGFEGKTLSTTTLATKPYDTVSSCVDVERHVFILGLQDLIDYWGGVNYNYRDYDYVNKFFLNTTAKEMESEWSTTNEYGSTPYNWYSKPFVRSANKGDSNLLHFSTAYNTITYQYSATNAGSVCPAFTINLKEFTNWEKIDNFKYIVDKPY